MKHVGPAIKVFLFFTVITGLAYPLLITALSQILFSKTAGGEILKRNNQPIGARLIAQKFVNEKYFWGRPSSVDYNPLPSGGSNLGPTSEALRKAVKDRGDQIRKAHGLSQIDSIPQELLFASGSGLDPEISPETAYFQVNRIAKERALSDTKKLNALIRMHTKGPDFGFIGEPRVNLLELNLALDELAGIPTIPPPPTPPPAAPTAPPSGTGG